MSASSSLQKPHILVSVLASSVADRGLEPLSN